MENFTVEAIAAKTGVSKNILYEWVRSDSEFTTALERLKDVQINDPFKTGTKEDTYVNAMMIALLLMETRNRHYKSGNI
jgi:transposase-like protein